MLPRLRFTGTTVLQTSLLPPKEQQRVALATRMTQLMVQNGRFGVPNDDTFEYVIDDKGDLVVSGGAQADRYAQIVAKQYGLYPYRRDPVWKEPHKLRRFLAGVREMFFPPKMQK